MQDVPPADIDHIEVISGPGATLWGANAVNGVINIITRKAKDTQGGLIDISAGNLEQSVGLRYGGTVGDDLAYRFYVRDYFGDDTETASGANAHDQWSRPQGGFRFDWTPSGSDSVTLQGDDFAGSEAQLGAPNQDISGRNLTAHWTHDFADGSSLQFLTYYDREVRATEDNGGNFWVDTYDLEVQHNFAPNGWNAVNWGGGLRISDYNIHGTPSLLFVPESRALDLSDIFAQDSVTIDPSLTAVFGFKIEDDPYSGVTPLPSGRLSWKIDDRALLWGAISRAVRSPTPFDEDAFWKKARNRHASDRQSLFCGRDVDGLRDRHAHRAGRAPVLLGLGLLQQLRRSAHDRGRLMPDDRSFRSPGATSSRVTRMASKRGGTTSSCPGGSSRPH